MRRLFLAAGMSAAVLACSIEPTRQQRAVDTQVIHDRLTAWTRMLNNQALDSLAGLHRADTAFTAAWPDGHRTRGWEEEAARLRSLFQDVATLNLVVQGAEVRVLDRRHALVTFRYSMDRILRSNARDVFAGQGTQLWVRPSDNAPWVVAASHLSRDPVPAGT